MLFGIGRARQDQVGGRRARVAVMADIDLELAREEPRPDLIGA
jgi:hypothetical protein